MELENRIDKYLTEKGNNLDGLNNKLLNDLHDSFYGIVDHMDNFVEDIGKAAKINKEMNPDYAIAKKMQALFEKLSIGKYL